VRTQRANFHHQLAHRLVNASGLIAMEDLRISHLTQAPEPKPDPDQEGHELPTGKAAKAGLNHSSVAAAWGQFQPFCLYTAAQAGRRVVLGDPSTTSQVCSGCARLVPKD
jgi:putative transposase